MLTTFVTLFGLPSAGFPAHPSSSNCSMNKLEGLEGYLDLINDLLIYGKDQAEHDIRLHAAPRRLEDANVTLNGGKCTFSQQSIGHVMSLGLGQARRKLLRKAHSVVL